MLSAEADGSAPLAVNPLLKILASAAKTLVFTTAKEAREAINEALIIIAILPICKNPSFVSKCKQ